MAPRSKLKVALAKEKGLTDMKLKQIRDKKKHKAVVKDKRKKGLLPEPSKEEDSEEDDEDYEDEEDDESDEAAEAMFDVEAEETDDDEDDSDEEEERGAMTAAAMMNESDSDSESEVDMEEKIIRPKKSILKKGETQPKKAPAEKKKNKKEKKDGDDEEEDDDDEQEDDEDSDIALSDLEDMPEDDREDLYVKTRLTINNQPALLAALKRISIPKDASVPFVTHQTVLSSEPTASKIEDISDDLNRELQLYAQSLEAAKRARAALRAEGAPFSRPKDYFAEMVKDDGHMQKVKDKLVQEATNKKASAEARKLRDLKKFGKQVQVAKLQERQKEKKDTLEKIKSLKKISRHGYTNKLPPLLTERAENGGEVGTTEADLFDVAVDSELNKPGKRSRDDQGGRAGNNKRAKKDAKFGFGGKKRHGKSGDATSSGDLTGFSAKRMKGQASGPAKPKPYKAARMGKSKRKAAAGKR
ncbi:rRNA-processing protein EBP2 [Cytospora mali]|uniref:rRNA-processing protein EBP2 n=1 Tax=Cytospora mali TaxID=578113 RepID=A0A194V1W2_CYTMA|nr:rRNA-processing protein EBP2 [Valsa mali var. pyri (nom. inval.)]